MGERKKREGDAVVYTQISRSSSMSSSDVEELDHLEEQGEMRPRHLRQQIQREAGARVDAMKVHAREYRPSNNREGWRGDRHPARADDANVGAARDGGGGDDDDAAQSGAKS